MFPQSAKLLGPVAVMSDKTAECLFSEVDVSVVIPCHEMLAVQVSM